MWPRSVSSLRRRRSRATCPRAVRPRSIRSTPLKRSSWLEQGKRLGALGGICMNIIGFVDSVARDLRYALRGLSRRPAFTFAAVLTLAVGIGATTAIFSVVYSVLIKPLPYPNAEDLVSVSHAAPGINITDGLGEDPTIALTYRDESRTFASIGLWQEASATLTERGEPERVRTLRVTDGTLQALGVQPMRGRWF